jgi:hypothetical protein
MRATTALFFSILCLSLPITFEIKAQQLVPNGFEVPTILETEQFRVRMLTVNDVVKDYDAVMSSWEYLQGAFGPNSTWPSEDLSLEQNLIDLGWHQKEFQRRNSFAYTVVTLDETRVIGCIYIYQTDKGDFDAQISMWVREDVSKQGYDAILFKTVKEWIAKDWPFQNPAYPGRSIDWDEWTKL